MVCIAITILFTFSFCATVVLVVLWYFVYRDTAGSQLLIPAGQKWPIPQWNGTILFADSFILAPLVLQGLLGFLFPQTL